MSESSSDGRIPLDEIEITGIEEHPETESVLLHGPPGTGKTTTAAARVALLIRDHGYSVNQVAWATYRRSLANDTLERLAEWGVISESELDEPTKGATRFISTIHAIANRAVGGLPQPIQGWHHPGFCKELGIRYSTKEPWEKSPGKELFRCFEWMANNCLDPADPADLEEYPYLGVLREQFPGDVADVWEAWERYKAGHEVIDFHEMLEAALEQRAVPPAEVLVVDEYHDATPLIARVSEMWMDAAEIVIVAGDPHQVVNQYDGADPRFFERLEGRYPRILLDTSYRVGQRHWTPATRVLAKAHDPPAVEPTGSAEIREYRSPSFAYSSDTGWQTPAESTPGSPAAIASSSSNSNDREDVMFLTRTKMQADGVGAALEQAGILYTSQAELGGWNTERGRTRHALYNALSKIEGVSPAGFDTSGLEEGLARYMTDDESKSPENIYLSSVEAAELLRHANAEYLAQSRGETKKHCERIEAKEAAQSLRNFNERVTPEFWTAYTSGVRSERQLIKNGRSERERIALRKALKHNERAIEPGEIGVTIMTIHASKGQEADDVVIYDGITNTIKTGMRENDETRKNEWRTWYVALTRASERLHIMRGGFEWTHSAIPTNIRAMASETETETEGEHA